jgi:AbiTii
MKLLDEIIEGAVSDTQPIGTVLRKCLVLERQVKNEKFRIWLNHELDGYDKVDELPDYRTINSISRGVFIGYAGSQINDQPLALHVMEEKHRKLVDKVRLAQPAASYEGRPDKSADGSLPWPPSLTTKYQAKFIESFVLNRAWQEVLLAHGAQRGLERGLEKAMFSVACWRHGRGLEISGRVQAGTQREPVA